MNLKQFHALSLRGTDVQEAIHRLYDDEAIYSKFLVTFLDDQTMAELNEAIEDREWDEAFTSAHALKGLAGNMGFMPLMNSVGRLTVLIRGGRKTEAGEYMEQVNSCYRDITDAIHEYIALSDKENKENEI